MISTFKLEETSSQYNRKFFVIKSNDIYLCVIGKIIFTTKFVLLLTIFNLGLCVRVSFHFKLKCKTFKGFKNWLKEQTEPGF